MKEGSKWNSFTFSCLFLAEREHKTAQLLEFASRKREVGILSLSFGPVEIMGINPCNESMEKVKGEV